MTVALLMRNGMAIRATNFSRKNLYASGAQLMRLSTQKDFSDYARWDNSYIYECHGSRAKQWAEYESGDVLLLLRCSIVVVDGLRWEEWQTRI